jgi:kynureninase
MIGPDITDPAHADDLDRKDELAPFRERFVVQDPDLIYLDGNSLGRLPRRTARRLREVIDDEWGGRLIRGWGEGWMKVPERVGGKIAWVIGAHPDEVILADSTSVNLFKLAWAALKARPGRHRVVTDDLNFPSDLYVLRGACEQSGGGRTLDVIPSADGIHGPVEALQAAIDEDTALLSLSHTAFKSAYTYDMAALTREAQQAGALVLWDLSHSAGAVPTDLAGAGADLAVGCTYKYLNGGPGAPAFLYVRRDLQESLANPIPGWMGGADMFAFHPEYRAAPGLRRFLTGTPPIVSLSTVEPAVDLLLEAGMDRIRTKSVRQTEYLIALWEQELAPRGFALHSPTDPQQRGSHLSLGHEHGRAIDLALIHEGKMLPDFRRPDNIRLGVAPLYTSFRDLHRAVETLARIVDQQLWKHYEGEARRGRDVPE